MILLTHERQWRGGETVVAFGMFDGVHEGHAQLMRKANELAALYDLKSVVYTFSSHPMATYAPEKTFVDALHPKHVVIGFNYSFGRMGAGKAEDMRRFGEKYGFETHVVDEVQIDGLPVSSTRVRAAIAAGEMEEAARLLGRPYALCGVIQRGKQLGRKLDFPTANLLWPEGKAIPPKGVYAARVYVDEAWYIAAVNVGTHPTAPGGPPTIEANLLDYEGGSLYGHHMRLLLCGFVRSEKKFDSLEALRDEVMKNREQVRTYFENRR